MRFARIESGVVAEIITLSKGLSPADVYHPAIAAACRPAASEVAVGWIEQGDELVAPAAEVVDPVALRTALTTAVDAEAERQRLRWITPGAGQAMTYARKADEARAAQADADPQPAAYPMLAASLGIDGATITAVADTVLAMDAAWGRIGSAIEARRLGLKRDIAAAADAAALAAINISAGWPDAT